MENPTGKSGVILLKSGWTSSTKNCSIFQTYFIRENIISAFKIHYLYHALFQNIPTKKGLRHLPAHNTWGQSMKPL